MRRWRGWPVRRKGQTKYVHVPVPKWFAEHRIRALSMFSALSSLGLVLTYYPYAFNPFELPWSMLWAMATWSGLLLGISSINGKVQVAHTGAGLASLLWFGQVGSLIWANFNEAIPLGGPLYNLARIIFGFVLLLQALFLYWVAGAEQEEAAR